jgi:hypothetical protein
MATWPHGSRRRLFEPFAKAMPPPVRHRRRRVYAGAILLLFGKNSVMSLVRGEECPPKRLCSIRGADRTYAD